jgi:hypothetical protein
VLLTPVLLVLADLVRLLLLLKRHTKSLVYGLIGRQRGEGGCSGGACLGAACLGAVKTSISISLWCPLNEVTCKQNI